MKGFSLKGENVKPEKWNPSKVSEILKTDGFWQVLYHQLATEETEEAEEKRRKVFRPRLNRNSIMELSIHNRLFILENLILLSFVILSDGCSSSAWLWLRHLVFLQSSSQFTGRLISRWGRSKHFSTSYSYAQGGVTYVENMGIPFNWHPILMTISLIFLYGNGEILSQP